MTTAQKLKTTEFVELSYTFLGRYKHSVKLVVINIRERKMPIYLKDLYDQIITIQQTLCSFPHVNVPCCVCPWSVPARRWPSPSTRCATRACPGPTHCASSALQAWTSSTEQSLGLIPSNSELQ